MRFIVWDKCLFYKLDNPHILIYSRKKRFIFLYIQANPDPSAHSTYGGELDFTRFRINPTDSGSSGVISPSLSGSGVKTRYHGVVSEAPGPSCQQDI